MRQSLLPLVLATTLGAQERPPNVVLIMADDIGAECFSFYGGTSYATVLALAWCRSKNLRRACAQHPNSVQGDAVLENKAL